MIEISLMVKANLATDNSEINGSQTHILAKRKDEALSALNFARRVEKLRLAVRLPEVWDC